MICYENFPRAFQNSCSARSKSRTFSCPDITVGFLCERGPVLPTKRESGVSVQHGLPLRAVKSDNPSQNYASVATVIAMGEVSTQEEGRQRRGQGEEHEKGTKRREQAPTTVPRD
jgi:hypothetical protein